MYGLPTRRHALALLLIGGLGVQAWAKTHNVATPAEVKKALKTVKPGDRIVLRDGVWRDADIRFEARGQAGKPIMLRAKTPGKVILTGKSRLRIGGQHLIVDGLWFKDGFVEGGVIEFRTSSSQMARNCRLTNTAVTNYNPKDKTKKSQWVSLFGAENRVTRCYFEGKTNVGPTLVVWLDGKTNNHQIDHNHFGPRPPLGQNSGESIRIGTSGKASTNSRTLVEYNLFDRCSGEMEIISNKSCGNVYRNNTFLDCEGTLTLRHGNRCAVESNRFIGNHRKHTGGVRVIGEGHKVVNNYFAQLGGTGYRAAIVLMSGQKGGPPSGYQPVKDVLVAFNTLLDCAVDFEVGLGTKDCTVPPRNCTIANNAVHGRQDPRPAAKKRAPGAKWVSNTFLPVTQSPTGAPSDGGAARARTKSAGTSKTSLSLITSGVGPRWTAGGKP